MLGMVIVIALFLGLSIGIIYVKEKENDDTK
jgi:hypothetical protein